jgi:hypothetical protein
MVNSIPKISAGWRRLALAASVLVFLLQPSSLLAQAPPIPERLPPDTVFYIHWHGKASLTAASAKNHVLQLYEDPDMAPLWQALISKLNAGKQGMAPAVVLAAVSSLLDNPAVVGFVANPNPQVTASPQSLLSLGGFFLVYDETGKADLIRMLTAASQTSAGTPQAVTNYAFGGTSVEVRTKKGSAIYTAHAGSYYLVSNQERTIEGLITRFGGGTTPAPSLGQTPEYQGVVKFLGSDTSVDFFGRLPDFTKWIPTGAKYKSLALFLEGLHLENVHAAGEGISFSSEATHARGAVLGDTSPGSLFDWVGPSSAVFHTQPAMGTAPSFSISRVDFRAAYQLIRAAVIAALPPQQASSVGPMESIAQSYLGMSISDALGLFSGELASASYYSEDGSQQALYAVTIEKPEDALRVLRAVAGKRIVAEDSSGNTTYLDLAYPYRDPATRAERMKFYYVAVTPQMMLTAPRKAMLRAAVEQLNSPSGGAHSGTIFADPEYIRMRSLLPGNLSGLTGGEIDQIPWDKLAATLEGQMEEARKQSKSSAPDLSWLKQMNFDVISRHLHRSVGGWWKNSTGVYFDSYIQ